MTFLFLLRHLKCNGSNGGVILYPPLHYVILFLMVAYGRRRYRRNYKRSNRYRKRFKKTSRRRRRRTSIGGFPKTKITKLRYVSAIQMEIEQGQQRSIRRWRANGIYDPDVNIGGHQPMNRDIYAAVYNRYCVLGAKLTLKYMLHNGGANTTEPLVVGVLVNDEILESSTVGITNLIENGRLSYKIEALNSASTSGTPKELLSIFQLKILWSKGRNRQC